MLDDTLKTQLQQYMGLLRQPLRLIASLDDSAASVDMRGLLDDIVAAGNGKIALDASGTDARTPSFVIARDGESHGVRFAGLPLGHEFESLVLALLWTGGHPPKVAPEVIEKTWLAYQPGTRRPFGVMEWPALLRQLDRRNPGYDV